MSGFAAHLPIGVYRGAGCGITAINQYEDFIGGEVNYVLDFMPDSPTWEQFENGQLGDNHGLSQNDVSVWAGGVLGNRKLVLAVPACVQGTTWAQEGGGTNDAHWLALGNRLINLGLGDSVIRIAREFNGWWYPWKVTNCTVHQYIAGYSRAVWLMKNLPGANFKFDWSSYIGVANLNQAGVGAAYPGDDWVDFIGVHAYEGDWTGIYDLGYVRTLEQQAQSWRVNVLNVLWGLKDWKGFAIQKNKPLSFPEWAPRLWNESDGYHGGGDNPYFVESMGNWMKNLPNFAYHAFWEDPFSCNGVMDPDNEIRRSVAVPAMREEFLRWFTRN
jgi:hypothetical protein